LFALRDSPEVHFAAPLFAEAGPAAPAPTPVRPDRLPDIVRAVPDPAIRTAVPPLLRSIPEKITVNLLRVAPVARIAGDEERPFNKRLVEAGVSTYGALLARTPEEAVEAVGVEHAQELSEVLEESESVAAAVSKAVYGAVAGVARESRAVTWRDFDNDDAIQRVSGAIAKALAEERRIPSDAAFIAALVADAVKGSGGAASPK
jgi:hypothetical protein